MAVILAILFLPKRAHAEFDEELDEVTAAILYEAGTDTVLFEKNADKRLAPASMTKIMTAILVLEKNPALEGELTVAEEAVDPMVCSDMEENHLYAGEVISVYDCMAYMLVPSGNEACTALACYTAGGVAAFVERMNEKAAELGCADTRFRDPIGLASGTHYTTCRDMVKICRYAMTFEKFREIVALNQGVVKKSNKRPYGFGYSTTNKIRYPGDKKLYFREWRDQVVGIKTGTTGPAGYCFAGCMEADGLVYYSVCMFGKDRVMPDNRTYRGDFLATLRLYDWARTLSPAQFYAGESVGSVPVEGGAAASVPVAVAEDAKLLLDGMTKAEVLAALSLPGSIPATVTAGDEIAFLTVTDAGGGEHRIALVAAKTVPSLALLIAGGLAVLCCVALSVVLLRRRARLSGQLRKEQAPAHGADGTGGPA